MCAVSFIGDTYANANTFPNRWPNSVTTAPYSFDPYSTPITRTEFEALKKEVLELKGMLESAKRFDEMTGQPDCEMDTKVKFIKDLAKFAGVNLGDVFKPVRKAKRKPRV